MRLAILLVCVIAAALALQAAVWGQATSSVQGNPSTVVISTSTALSLGLILPIAAVIGSAAGAWYAIGARLTRLETTCAERTKTVFDRLRRLEDHDDRDRRND